MAVSGFTWYQGEANVGDDAANAAYGCHFPAMIAEWRNRFQNPDAYFGFVQLSTWCDKPTAIAGMRDAQMKGLSRPKVGYSTNADHGAGCNIHPPDKQYPGERLARSALAMHYGEQVQWRSPSYGFATAAVTGNTATVTVSLSDVSSGGLVVVDRPYNMIDGLNCTDLNAKQAGTCAWATIEIQGGQSFNATASVDASGTKVVLRATVPSGVTSAQLVATSYGFGAIPMMNVYDRTTGLPVLPWHMQMQVMESQSVIVI